MAQRKDFSSSRAMARVKRLSEDEVMFGHVASDDDAEKKEVAAEQKTTPKDNPKPNPKRELNHQVTVLLDDDLFYRMKSYLVQPHARWRSASVMLRELLEEELGRKG